MTTNSLASGAAAPGGTESGATVLVVEDEDGLRLLIRRLLENEGYTVLEASNGALALQLLTEAGGTEVELVLTDLRMPVMDGRQLAAALARLRPSLPIVFMSGYTAHLMDMRTVSPKLAFLPKPLRTEDLLTVVRSHCGSRHVRPVQRSHLGIVPKTTT